ncbi:MAG: hypothetical protein IPG18_12980 [Saprospiraceae bacterium]|nr:hypothetical protein [Saprospiraceae bacterium]
MLSSENITNQSFYSKLILRLCIAVILFIGLSGCQTNSGLYNPSFSGIQSVYNEKQFLSAISAGPGLGTYYNYSPLKNLAFFGDLRFTHLIPQTTIALGGYSSYYKTKTILTKSGLLQKNEEGFHFDSYLGYTFVRSTEYQRVEIADPFGFVNTRETNTFDLTSNKMFLQFGSHLKGRNIKLDLLYRLNYLDIEKIVVKPENQKYEDYLQILTGNNPFLFHETQLMVGIGSGQFKTNFGIDFYFPVNYADQLNYSNFFQLNVGFSYIFDRFDHSFSK